MFSTVNRVFHFVQGPGGDVNTEKGKSTSPFEGDNNEEEINNGISNGEEQAYK